MSEVMKSRGGRLLVVDGDGDDGCELARRWRGEEKGGVLSTLVLRLGFSEERRCSSWWREEKKRL